MIGESSPRPPASTVRAFHRAAAGTRRSALAAFGAVALAAWAACSCERPARLRAVRPPALAGIWYERDPERLRPQLEGYLAGAPRAIAEPVQAIVAAHAAYDFSGPIAGAAWGPIRGHAIDRVVVLADSHTARFPGAALPNVDHFGTPFGPIALDTAALDLLALHTDFAVRAAAFDDEHAMELQLPWIRLQWPEAKLVPVILGQGDEAYVGRVASALRQVLYGRTLVVASADFAHVGPAFDWVPPWWAAAPADRLAALERFDREGLGALLRRDLVGVSAFYRRDVEATCGRRTLRALLALAGPGEPGELLAYGNSLGPGPSPPDAEDVVTYAAVAFRGRFPAAAPLTPADRLVALDLARAAARDALRGAPLPEPAASLSPRLRSGGSAYVTVEVDGRVRGCIGYVGGTEPLARVVVLAAADAATADSRYPPLKAEELARGRVSVSVLAWPPRRIRSPFEIEIGRHGVYLEKGQASALYLPRHAVREGLSSVGFAEAAARKAGLAPEGWRDAALSVFGVDEFSDAAASAEPADRTSPGTAPAGR